MAPLFFSPINGARLWIHFGGFEFQPIEFSKLLLCVFFASYFAANKELLSIPSARLGNRLVLDPRPLIPILVAWGVAMVIIGLEDDIGFAALLFTLFIGLLWITTGRAGYLVFGFVLFAVGAIFAAHFFSQVHLRVDEWLNPWPTNNNPNYSEQLSDGWFYMGTGGLGGTGLGLFQSPQIIPEITSDMIFAAIAVEMGMIGAAAVAFAYTLLVGAGLRIAQTARSDFSRLMATGLTIIIGFQAFFIMAGRLAAPALHRHHPAVRGLRGVVTPGQLRPHRAPHADLRRRGHRRRRPRSRPAWPNPENDPWCRPAERPGARRVRPVSSPGAPRRPSLPTGARPPGSAPARACARPGPARPRGGTRCAPARCGAMRSSSAR